MGKLLLFVLASFRFPVLQVFPGLPDYPSCNISNDNVSNSKSYHHLAKAAFYMITAVVGVGLFVYGEYTFCVFVGLKCSYWSTSGP